MTTLDLRGNQLTDFSFLEGLINLTKLNLANNNLTSFTLPEGLTSLTELRLGKNNLMSLNLPDGLTSLTTLYLYDNNLTSLTLPEGLTSLTDLDLGDNDLRRLIVPEGMNLDTFLYDGVDRQTVTFYRPVLRIRDIAILSTGDFQLTITGPQSAFTVESSPDMESWTEEGQLTIDEWKTTIAVPVQREMSQQFFRVRELDN